MSTPRVLSTHCKRGHEYEVDGYYTRTKDGYTYRECKPCAHAGNRRRATPESTRSTWLKRAYGISIEEYDRLLAEQHGKCAACCTDTPGRGKEFFSVDHCHDSGKVRGLLCHSCNTALGFADDSVTRLVALTTYLLERGA